MCLGSCVLFYQPTNCEILVDTVFWYFKHDVDMCLSWKKRLLWELMEFLKGWDKENQKKRRGEEEKVAFTQ